jgi:ABC-type lipoprotein release transport system permease subunit
VLRGLPSVANAWLLRHVAARLDVDAPVSASASMDEVLSKPTWPVRVFGMLVVIFGAVAVRLTSVLMFEVRPNDPLVFAIVAAVLGGAAFVACIIPAVRATRVDPVIALRAE